MRKVFGAAILILGVAAFFVCVPRTAWAVNIVGNGGFETGFADWAPPSGGFTFIGNNPHSGLHDAELGPVGALGSLHQMLTTVSGQTYNLTYWLANNEETCCPNEFRVSWNGSPISDVVCPAQTSGFCAPFDYTQFAFDNLLATGTSTVLDFGARQDPSYFSLDDVSVTPEPSTVALAVPGVVPFALAYLKRKRRGRVSPP